MVETATATRAPVWTRRILIALGLIVVLFGLIQLIPSRITNPPVRAEPAWDSPQTRQLAVTACYDCHSNETRSYWYEKVAPVSWWIKNHVSEGRSSLNFSEWDPNNHRSGTRIAEAVREGSMPPSYYTWLGRHPDAKLTPAQKEALVTGLENTIGPATGSRAGREGE
jgi:hypothetical protein